MHDGPGKISCVTTCAVKFGGHIVKPMSRFASGFAIGSVSLESLDLRFLTDVVLRREEDKVTIDEAGGCSASFRGLLAKISDL